MGLRHVPPEWKQKPVRSTYKWLNKGKVTPVLKWPWLGIVLTAILVLEFVLAVFIFLVGFIGREIYLGIMNPMYPGHPLIRGFGQPPQQRQQRQQNQG